MNYEDMTYEEKAKRLLSRLGLVFSQSKVDLLVDYLKLEYELGGRDELKKQLDKVTND